MTPAIFKHATYIATILILISISGVSSHVFRVARKRGHHKLKKRIIQTPLLNPGYPTDYSKFTVAAANPGWGKSLNPFLNRFQYEFLKIKDGHFGLSRSPQWGSIIIYSLAAQNRNPSSSPKSWIRPAHPRVHQDTQHACTHKKPLSSRHSFSFSDRTAL